MLKQKIKDILATGKRIKLEWECGGDEAFLYILIDDKQITYKDITDDLEGLIELEIYLMNFLNLPDAGEFSLQGGGKIIEENDNLYLVCESTMSYYEEYDEDSDKNSEPNNPAPAPEIDEEFSGKKELFR